MPNHKHADEYLIYTRKSTDDADNQKNSIDYQVGQCLKFAANKFTAANFTLAGFCENGIIKEKHSAFKTSGLTIKSNGTVEYKIERPKFQVLAQKLLNKEFKGLICLCWDRISRNDQDGMIIKNLIAGGADVRFVQTNYEKSSSGDLHMDIDGMFSQHYSRVISEKVKAAAEKLKAEGKCIYMAPIGYLDNGSDDKPIDSERAPIVKRLFEMYSTGEWSLAGLAKWANQQGLTSKPSRKRRTKQEMLGDTDPETLLKFSRPVNNKTIENILRNPFYIGKLKIDKRDNGKFIDGKFHQPLIDISLYNRVQAVLKSKNVAIHYVDKDFFTYRSIVRCACGRGYSPYIKKGFTYYRCRCVDDCKNNDKNLKEENIHKAIISVLSRIQFTNEELLEIEARAKTGLENLSNTRNKELDDLHIQRKKYLGDLDYITKNKITLLRNNAMSMEEIIRQENQIKKELALINEKALVYQDSAHEMLKYIITFSELVKMANLYYEHALDSEKREIATQVFSELIFTEGKLSNFKAKEGFAALLNRFTVISGSRGGIRTHDQLVNSQLRYRCATREYFRLAIFCPDQTLKNVLF